LLKAIGQFATRHLRLAIHQLSAGSGAGSGWQELSEQMLVILPWDLPSCPLAQTWRNFTIASVGVLASTTTSDSLCWPLRRKRIR
jgi:hypothetical protein